VNVCSGLLSRGTRKAMKGYIVGFKSRASADHQIIDYWFSDSANDAMRWDIRELAEADVRLFNRGITINEDLGQPHLLQNFEIEEVEAEKFIVFAEGPFVVRPRTSGSGRGHDPTA
jgi:hypothetical protein